jgi:transposase-like protein
MEDPTVPLCPHCKQPVTHESSSSRRVGAHNGSDWSEWHCDQCGRSFSMDYFDPLK